MKLYFLRHAHAEDGMNDHDRRLTPKGIQQANVAARVLSALDLEPTHIFTSPRVRARQTAEIVGEKLGISPEIREEVNFGFGMDALSRLLDTVSENADILLVGHEPTFSVTIGELSGGRIEMKKCGFARVDVTSRAPLRGTLVWLIPPKVFSAINGKR